MLNTKETLIEYIKRAMIVAEIFRIQAAKIPKAEKEIAIRKLEAELC